MDRYTPPVIKFRPKKPDFRNLHPDLPPKPLPPRSSSRRRRTSQMFANTVELSPAQSPQKVFFGGTSIDVILNYNRPSFGTTFKKVLQKLIKVTAPDFFKAILPLFSPETPVKVQKVVLKTLYQWLKQKAPFIQVFIDSPIPSAIQFLPETMELAGNLFCLLISNNRRILDLALLNRLKALIPTQPRTFVVIFSIYTEWLYQINFPLPIIGSFLDAAPQIIRYGEGAQLAKVLYAFVKRKEAIYKVFYHTIQRLFVMLVMCGDPDAANAGFSFLCSLKVVPVIPMVHLLMRIAFKDTCDSAILYLSKLDNIVMTKELLSALIMASQFTENAVFILCKIADTDEGGTFLITSTEWLSEEKLKLRQQIRIFMVLYSRPEFRGELCGCSEFVNFLRAIVDGAEEPICAEALWFICQSIEFTIKLEKTMRAIQVVQKMIYVAATAVKTEVVCAALSVLRQCAVEYYTDEYIGIIKCIPNFVNTPLEIQEKLLYLIQTLVEYESFTFALRKSENLQNLNDLELPRQFLATRNYILDKVKT